MFSRGIDPDPSPLRGDFANPVKVKGFMKFNGGFPIVTTNSEKKRNSSLVRNALILHIADLIKAAVAAVDTLHAWL